MRGSVIAGLGAGLIAASAVVPRPAAAQKQCSALTYVMPGDTGLLQYAFSVTHAPPSNGNLLNTTLVVDAPDLFQFTPPTPALLIAPGGTQNIGVNYTIDPSAVDNSFSVALTPISSVPAAQVQAPLAASACIQSFYIDTTPPQVTVTDANGVAACGTGNPATPCPVTPGNGTTDGFHIQITVDDFASLDSDDMYGSGPGKIEIWSGSPDAGTLLGTQIQAYSDYADYDESSTGLSILSALPSGAISLRAYDQAGNATVIPLTVASSLPMITLDDVDNSRFEYSNYQGIAQAPFPTTNSSDYELSLAASSATTLTSVSLTQDGGDADNLLPPTILPIPDGSTSLSGSLDNLTAGTYQLTVTNNLGQVSQVTWQMVVLNIDDAQTLGSAYASGSGSSRYIGGGAFAVTVNVSADSTLGGVSVDPPTFTLTTTFDNNPADGTAYKDVVVTDEDGNSDEQSFVAQSNVFPTDAPFDLGGCNITPSSGECGGPIAAFPSGQLPSSVVLAGPLGFGIFTGSVAVATPVLTETDAGAITSVQPIGTVMASIDGCMLMQDEISIVGPSNPGTVTHSYSYSGPCPVNASSSFLLKGTISPQTSFVNCQQISPDDPTMCLVGDVYNLNVIGGGLSIFSQALSDVDPAFAFESGQSTATLAFGIQLSNLDLSTSTTITAEEYSQPPILGYADVQPNVAYFLSAIPVDGSTGPILNSPVTVNLDYGSVGLTQNQESSVLVAVPGPGRVPTVITPNAIDVSSHTLSFNMTQFVPFKLVRSVFVSSVSLTSGEFAVDSNQNARFGNPSSDPRYAQFLNVLASTGIIPVSSQPMLVTSTNTAFNPMALFRVSYSTTEMSAAGVGFNALRLGQYSLNNASPLISFSVQADTTNLNYSALLSGVSSAPVLGVFAATTTRTALADLLAPQTTVLAGGTAVSSQSMNVPITISSTMTVSFSTLDPPYANAPVSGVAETRYLVDQTYVSTAATPGQHFAVPLSLSQGGHTVTYFSRDNANNYEAPRTVTINVATPSSRGSGGDGIGADNANLLWSVFLDTNNTVNVAHDDASGVVLASAALPNADPAFPWTVFFDTTGAAYAVGSALNGSGNDVLAIYKASPAGDAVVSSQTFDSGFGGNNYVFGATAPGWAVGAVQMPDGGHHGNFSMAIWRFNAATGQVQLTTTSSRGAGFDAATGLAVDGAGNLWISGFSQSPNPRSPWAIDLAVWEYAPDGRTLLAGPIIREGYLDDFNTGLLALVSLSSGTAFVAAPRVDARGGTDMEFLGLSMSSDTLLFESAWRSDDAAPVAPGGLLQDAFGRLVAVGSFDYGDGTTAGVWRYGTDGSLQSVTQANAGGAEGATFDNSELWLSVDGSTSPFLLANETAVTGASADIEPPRTSLVVSPQSFANGQLYIASSTLISFSTADDAYAVGDNLGVGVSETFEEVDGAPFSLDTSSAFAIVAEGTHTIVFYSLDFQGNAGVFESSSVALDDTPPVSSLQVLGSSTTDAYGGVIITSGTSIALSADDPISNGVASGVSAIYYVVDTDPLSPACAAAPDDPTQPSGTCANDFYDGPFDLSVGTHTVYYFSEDNVGNQEVAENISSITVQPGMSAPVQYTLNPSTGPIGIPFTIAGPGGFGAYAGAATEVLIGGATAPLSVWNDTTINGTIPGLSTGTYPVYAQIHNVSSTTALVIGSFAVLQPSPTGVVPSSGPIGAPFTVTGAQFGPYAGALTQFLFDGKPAPLSVWNDTTISGTVPNVSTGTHDIWIQRQSSDGGLMTSSTGHFLVTAPSVASISPSSGPIGATFALSGVSFGPYAGALTQVLVGGTTAPLSLWNDAHIAGTIPGGLNPGTYPVLVQRQSSDGGLITANTVYFQVVNPMLAALAPSTGPIGIPFTISGTGFGAYAGANTVVLLGGTTAALSLWNNTTISGTIPALSTGAYPVYVEILQGASFATSCVSTFDVTALSISTPTPSAAPPGAPFALNGTGFGPYAGTATQVLLGGATVALSVWNDAQITGTVPTLPAGPQPLWIERFSGTGLEVSDTIYFQVTAPSITSISPSSGPIGVAFTLSGSGFGPYAGHSTQVLMGGVSVAVSVWNDTTISGTVPGALSAGTYPVLAARQAPDGGLTFSNTAYFQVVSPGPTGMTPSTGPIGIPFTISGSGFGAYAGSNTELLFGGTVAPLSLWNDTQISGTVPGLSTGAYAVTIQIQQGSYMSSSFVSTFTVILPQVYSLTPSSAPIGAPFTFSGYGFGPYAGSNTSVLFNGVVAPLSVWNESHISGSVPGSLSTGPVSVVIQITAGSSSVQTSSQAFVVLQPTILGMAPASGPDGTGVQLTGFGFGPYQGSATSVYIGTSAAALSVWNDEQIVLTVPSNLPDGTYPLVVQISPSGGSVQSASMTFTVASSLGGESLALSAPPLAAQPDWHFAGDLFLSTSAGGHIQSPSLAGVQVPPGALSTATAVSMQRTATLYAADRAAALTRAALGAGGEAISYGPEGTQFKQPVTLELPYDPGLVSPGQLSQLAIHYYDPVAKTWTPLITQADPVRHLLTAQTSHFSLYQPLGRGIGTAAVDASFGFKAVYVFPNPVRGASSVDVRVQPGQADGVEVHIYDLTGRKIHSSSDFAVNPSFDDMNGLGPQITYDHVWDVSGVGSGVYTYVVIARKAGNADIHKTGKIAVVK